MKFVCISDVHIKEPGDLAAELFSNFLKSEPTKSADIIFLLGDIFDLVVGGQKEYLEKYTDTFEEISDLIKQDKKVVMFEGNHDFHFNNLIDLACEKWGLERASWEYRTTPLKMDVAGMPTLFAHGDEIEIENLNYKIYRAFIRSYPIKFLANYVVPHSIVDSIGVNASEKSRERNIERYGNDNNEQVREKFRRVFKHVKKTYQVKNLICGHSHCMDFIEDDGFYINNGFFPKTKTFTYFDGTQIRQFGLETS